MSEASQGLQLLVDSFAGSEDPEERDDLLQDIIAHPTPQALGFLRLVAENEAEDRYLRCDAFCALCARTAGAEQLSAVLLYLGNPYDAYEYSSACLVIGGLKLEAAVPLMMTHFDAPLEEACLDATVQAVEAIGGFGALTAWLDAQGDDVDEARALLVCGAIERLRVAGTEANLKAFAEKMRGVHEMMHLAAAAMDAANGLARPTEDDSAEDDPEDLE